MGHDHAGVMRGGGAKYAEGGGAKLGSPPPLVAPLYLDIWKVIIIKTMFNDYTIKMV